MISFKLNLILCFFRFSWSSLALSSRCVVSGGGGCWRPGNSHTICLLARGSGDTCRNAAAVCVRVVLRSYFVFILFLCRFRICRVQFVLAGGGVVVCRASRKPPTGVSNDPPSLFATCFKYICFLCVLATAFVMGLNKMPSASLTIDLFFVNFSFLFFFLLFIYSLNAKVFAPLLVIFHSDF